MKSRQHNLLTDEPKAQGAFFNRNAAEETVAPVFETTTGHTQAPAIQKKCAACEQEEEVQKKDIAIQKAEETGSTATPPPAEPPATAAQTMVPGTPATARYIAEDSAIPEPGQMRKSEFSARLKTEVCASVNEALAGSPFTSDNCPYIQSIFAIHQNSSPARIEALISRYAPETQTAQTAEQVIQMLRAKAFSKTREWLANGGTAGLATQMLSAVTGGISSAFSAIGSGISSAADTVTSGLGSIASGIGNMFFKENTGGVNTTQSPQAVMNSLGKGQSIDGGTRSKMEGAFGNSFSNVEIHTDSHAAQLSKDMNARAFTVGNHIAFAPGEYQPGNIMGDALLAHELAHTVQQQQGETSGTQMKGSEYNELETDADNMAVNVMSKLNGGKDKNVQNKVKKGLTVSRCSNNSNKQPQQQQQQQSQTQLSSGGINGLTLNATFNVSNTNCNTLQIIQVFWGTRRSDGQQVGTYTFQKNNITYDAFVDGGKNSPFVVWGGSPPAHATNPYYLTQQEHAAQVNFAGNSGTVNVYDRPGAVAAHQEAHFETAVVCVNHNNTGKDKILQVFKWGWTNQGTVPEHTGGIVLNGKSTGITFSGSPSAIFKQIVANDYPNYQFN